MTTKVKTKDTWRTLEAVGEYVIVREVEKQASTESGILLPSKAQEQPPEGIVLGLGIDALTDAEDQFTVGDHVVFLPHAGSRVTSGDETVKVMLAKDIIAVRRK